MFKHKTIWTSAVGYTKNRFIINNDACLCSASKGVTISVRHMIEIKVKNFVPLSFIMRIIKNNRQNQGCVAPCMTNCCSIYCCLVKETVEKMYISFYVVSAFFLYY